MAAEGPGETPMQTTTIAASYERVSTRNQGQHGFSLGAQHATLEEFAAANGWHLPEHLRERDGEDEDASGADWDLPGLNRLLEAARRREFSVLVVPDFDRFARNLVKGLVLEEQLKQYGVRVVFQRVPVEDSPEGQLLKTQLYAFAEYDRQKIKLRTMVGKRAKAQSGRVVGAGRAAYGLRYVYETLTNGKERVCALEPDPIAGPIARDILLGLRHRSIIETMTDLNDRGLTGPRGGRWNVSTLYDMANNPVYAGTWLYGRRERRRRTIGDPMAVAVPVRDPLITSDEWDAIQAALIDRQHRRRGRQPVERESFPLRGRMVCGRCGGILWAMTNHTTRYYACPCFRPSAAERLGKAHCELPAVYADDLESELLRVLYATLLDADRLAAGLSASVQRRAGVDRLRTDRLAAIDAQIAGHRKRLDGLAGDLLDAGEGEFRAAIRRRAEEIEGIIARLVRDRDELAAMQGNGLSAEAADSITAFATEVREGLDNATTADLMHLYDLLQIRGTVQTDPKGVQLGRKHRYVIDWQGAIQLRSGDQSLLMM
jgi:site-specific DNA recombinase